MTKVPYGQLCNKNAYGTDVYSEDAYDKSA